MTKYSTLGADPTVYVHANCEVLDNKWHNMTQTHQMLFCLNKVVSVVI